MEIKKYVPDFCVTEAPTSVCSSINSRMGDVLYHIIVENDFEQARIKDDAGMALDKFQLLT